MPAETLLYPTKSLRYQICEFFIDRRRREAGLGGPIRIKLKDLGREVYEYANSDNEDERIKAIGDQLYLLNKEWFGDSLEREVINILNLPAPADFLTAFRENKEIEVRCLSKNLEDYVSELKTRTRVAIREKGLVELEQLPSRINIILGDKEMYVGKSKKNNFNLSINIVQLMYSGSVNILGDVFSLSDNYERKDFVLYLDLLRVISHIEDDVNENNQEKILKSIKDAVRDLNKRSMEIFEHPIFEEINEGLSWIL